MQSLIGNHFLKWFLRKRSPGCQDTTTGEALAVPLDNGEKAVESGGSLVDQVTIEEALKRTMISELIPNYVFSAFLEQDGKITLEWGTGTLFSACDLDIQLFFFQGMWEDFVLPEDIPSVAHFLQELWYGNPGILETRVRMPTNEICWLRTTCREIKDHENETSIRHVIGAIQDITDHKLYEERTYRQIQAFESLMDAADAITSSYATPLASKSQAKGVQEGFHHSSRAHHSGWLDFLEGLASQAELAIENASLFNDLQQLNIELNLAYDSTIESWARALDLRDRETEGHSRRVAEITLCLAKAMSVDETELIQIRRGALLHDIGKLCIPDSILLKPGPLNEEEMDVIRKHPTIAFDLLSPIDFLRPALEIPYCHHEKWDGTGYPRGLMGEQIPMAARIFAVVDVWDALLSNRPYRAGWPEAEVCSYLQKQAGRHFDPQVVDVFLSLPADDKKHSPKYLSRESCHESKVL